MYKKNAIIIFTIGLFLIMGVIVLFGTEISKIRNEKMIHLYSKDQTADQIKNQTQQSQSTNPSQKMDNDSNPKISDENFKNWIQTEVKNLETPVKNPIESERNTKIFVNQLSTDQITQLKNKIINSDLPMNERIFSNYAVTLFEGENSNQIIFELLNHSVPEFKNVQVHSTDEVKRGQEYALKYMQIDELAKRSENGDRGAYGLLAQISQNSLDAKIKNYAQQKIAKIPH